MAVDIRPDSPTFGKWEGVELDAADYTQLFIPAGFAHGFCVLSESADMLYKMSTVYDAEREPGGGVVDCSSCTLRHRARGPGGVTEKTESAAE